MEITANKSRQPLHFMVFPMLASGHMIPMIDVARILARCDGVIVTIFTTPVNAKRFRSMLDRERQCGFQIREHELRFPCKEAGLPEGCENADLVPKGKNLEKNFMAAVGMMRPQAEELVRRSEPPASCIISDMVVTWTAEIAEEMNIPRIVFNGSCCFSHCCSTKIMDTKILGTVKSETEMFTVPEFPDKVQLCKSQVKGCIIDLDAITNEVGKQLAEKFLKDTSSAYGAIVNSFDELEPYYVEEYTKKYEGRMWCVGPVALSNQEYHQDRAAQKDEQHECLKWLGLHAPRSTIYVSLGSLATLTPGQMRELAMGLETSKRPFVWVLGKGGKHLDAFEDWNVKDGFEERNKGRGMLVREWAPQVLILSHPSVGGFLTHCGWNSTLEAISIGVPMLIWPMFAEQFLNEKLVVEVLGIGVSIGLKVSVKWDGNEEDIDNIVVVKNEVIKEAIHKLMDEEDEEGIERRRKVKELAEKAMKAVQKDGSSHLNLMSLIQHVSSYRTTKL